MHDTNLEKKSRETLLKKNILRKGEHFFGLSYAPVLYCYFLTPSIVFIAKVVLAKVVFIICC